MHAKFSPNGKYIAYVFDNNLYIYNTNWNITTQITFDGEKNKIINGASDWVYEEEFGLVRSFKWSNDSKHIAYYKFDESKVKEFSMDLFKGGLYPTQEVFKYPKAGEDNSYLSLHLYNLNNKKTIDLINNNTYEYFPRINWFDESEPKLAVYGMNRHQNKLDFIIIDTDGNKKTLFSETDKYYIDVHDNLTYLEVLTKDLKVMDASAVSLARENKIPIVVCSIVKNNNLTRVLNGKGSYTIISD